MWKEKVSSVLIFLIFATQITSDMVRQRQDAICDKTDQEQITQLLTSIQERDMPTTLIRLGAYQPAPPIDNLPSEVILKPPPPHLRPYPKVYDSRDIPRQYKPIRVSSFNYVIRHPLIRHSVYHPVHTQFPPKVSYPVPPSYRQLHQGYPQNIVYELKRPDYIREPYLMQKYPESLENIHADKFPYRIELPIEGIKGTKESSVEVLKALTYSLPSEIITFHPTHLTKEYLFKPKPGSTKKEQILKYTEPVTTNGGKSENYKPNANDTKGNSIEITENKENSQDQYFRQNNQPITFDNSIYDEMESNTVSNNVEIYQALSRLVIQPETKEPVGDEEDLAAESSEAKENEKKVKDS